MIQITQAQKDTAEKYIKTFEEVREILKNHKSIFTFLKSRYIPEYGDTKQNSRDAIKNRVIAEIILEEDTNNLEVEKIVGSKTN